VTAHAVEEAGARPTCRVCDVTDITELQRTIEELDGVDVLVNCAGANQPEQLLDVQPDTFERLWRLNVQAAFFASQAAARAMVEHRRSGVIVNISSQMGHVGAALRSVYCTTKHAVEGMTKAMAVELAAWDIRVVSIAPTFTRTGMTEQQLRDPGTHRRLLAQIPLGRFGEAEDTAAAVVFVSSPGARMLTGASLIIDGGWTAK
jgi:NAD(P)-dependent dehydrogenase (short-subunit alcohol dehydrogenase family)